MAKFSKKVGRATGDQRRDIQALYDYISWLVEQLEYSNGQMEKQLAELTKVAALSQQEEA